MWRQQLRLSVKCCSQLCLWCNCDVTAVVRLLSKRCWIPIAARLEGPKLEPEVPRAEVVFPRWVFEHSRHSVWLLWPLNKVWRLQHLSTPSMDKCKWQNDPELQFFLQNVKHREKYSSIKCADWWITATKVPDLNCEVHDLLLEVVDLKQEVPDLRSGGILPPI